MKARIRKVDGKHVLLIPTDMLQQLGLSDKSVVELFDVKGNIVVQPQTDHAQAAAERFHDLVHSALAMR
jgi:antitoxin component of MazEF toxin-antitoxin module